MCSSCEYDDDVTWKATKKPIRKKKIIANLEEEIRELRLDKEALAAEVTQLKDQDWFKGYQQYRNIDEQWGKAQKATSEAKRKSIAALYRAIVAVQKIDAGGPE